MRRKSASGRWWAADLAISMVLGSTLLACSSSKSSSSRSDAGASREPMPDAGPEGADASLGDAALGDAAPDASPPLVSGATCDASVEAGSCILRVDGSHGAPDATGASWDSAISDLQAALDQASCGCEVWLAEGTYFPTRKTDWVSANADHLPNPDDERRRAFLLSPGVAVYGGFVGDENERSARQPDSHQTVLSGDLGELENPDDNAYHVVVAFSDATLDGLTIRDGNADGSDFGQGAGGGLLAVGADMELRHVRFESNGGGNGGAFFNDTDSTPHLVDCEFDDNHADVGGALLITTPRTVRVEGSSFVGNVAPFGGGAISHRGGELQVENSRFSGNRSDFGAAIHAFGADANVENCWFEANVATAFGGSILAMEQAQVVVSNSVIADNASVGHGGALAAWTASISVSSTTISGNYAVFGGAFLVKDGSDVRLLDSVVWNNPDDDGNTAFIEGDNNTFTASNSDVPATIPGSGNFEADPLFANIPLLTRFTSRANVEDVAEVPESDVTFAVGDVIEVGDDGVGRAVTAVTPTTLSFSPALPAATTRFMRVDKWPTDTEAFTLDLHPLAGSPLIDRASAAAPAEDVLGQPRIGLADAGASCDAGSESCGGADLGALEFVPP